MARTSDLDQQGSDSDAPARRSGNGETNQLGKSFEAAITAATSAPDSEEAWDHLEELADALQQPDEVAAAYRETLDAELPREAWAVVARRAARFHDEWFGDNPEAIHALLSKSPRARPRGHVGLRAPVHGADQR